MWRAAFRYAYASRTGAIPRRRPLALAFSVFAPPSGIVSSRTTANRTAGDESGDRFGAGRNDRWELRRYSSSAIRSNSDGNSDTDGASKQKREALIEDDDDDDDDDEGWVPPMRGRASGSSGSGSAEDSDATTEGYVLPRKSERIERVLEVSRQVRERERLDRALRDTEREAEALFQLTEEEQATLTDEEILERLEEVLRREEELEEELFRNELEREEREKLRLQQQQQQQKEEEEEEQMQQMQQMQQHEAAPDWLQTRRSRRETRARSSTSAVPVIHHTPLTADEIRLLLEEHGGSDVTVIEDDPEAPRMGGAEGMIFCTAGGGSGSLVDGHNPYLVSTLGNVLIDHMKDRGLDELGTAPSARQNTRNRSASVSRTPAPYGTSGGIGGGGAPESSWKIVDCGNYIVHLLDGATRNDLRLEDLWSGFDRLWDLDILDEEAVEDYCAENPVPPGYDGTTGGRRWRGSDPSDDHINRNDRRNATELDGAVLKRLERNQFGFARRHRPVIPRAVKNRNRRAGRKQLRLQKERAHSGEGD